MDDAVCIVNIGPAQRRRRRSIGIAALLMGIGLVFGLWALDLPPVTRLSAALFFFSGFSGIFQARAKT